jgi:Tfp pilus assembly protein PilN
MIRTPFVERLLSKPRRLFVVETDGFGLRAAVLTSARGEVSFERVVATREAEPDAALAEVVSALRAEGAALPGEALLLTATALPALLDLPVPPGRPRPHLQMQEMVRWEMEPLFVQRVGVWQLGAILIRRGFLRPDQVEAALREIGNDLETPRLGDWAVARGWITQAQQESCLAIQKRLQTTDDEIVCGWSGPASAAEGPARAEQKFPWLVCGMGRSDRLEWVNRFGMQGLLLQGIYPLVGCAVAALNGDLSGVGMVIETHGGMMGCMRLEKGWPTSLQVLYTHTPSFTTAHPVSEEEGAIYWTEEAGAPAPRQQQRPIAVAVSPDALPEGISATRLSGLLGAARHHWGLEGGARTACVPAFDPGPPPWQRPRVWWIGAGLVTLLVIAGMEGALAFQRNRLQARHTELRGTLAEREKSDQALLSLQKEIASLQTTLTERKAALKSLSERLRDLSMRGTGRAERVASLLDRITMALPDTVTLTRVNDGPEGIQIAARASSEGDLSQFSLTLSEALSPLEIKIQQIEHSMEKAPALPDEMTYAMTLTLVPIPLPSSPLPEKAPPSEPPSLMQKMMKGLRGLVDGEQDKETKEANE